MMRWAVLLCVAVLPVTNAGADPLTAAEAAKRFGQQEDVEDISLSPDGTKIAIVRPGKGPANGVLVADLATGKSAPAGTASGKPLRMTDCDWISNARLVCDHYGAALIDGTLAPFTRLIAVDKDGGNVVPLGAKDAQFGANVRQYDGEVLEWGDGGNDTLLIARRYVPQETTYQQVGSKVEGLGVDRLDTRTLALQHVEPARGEVVRYLSDGAGAIRMKASDNTNDQARTLSGVTSWYYRKSGSRDWLKFGDYANRPGDAWPLAVEAPSNSALVLKSLDGRDALYRVALDGSMKTDLLYANPAVDVEGVVSIGRQGRIIGALYVTDRREVVYFDPVYKALAAALARAIPRLPLIRFLSASADEQKLLLLASSDNDPGHYYLFDRAAKRLTEVMVARAALEGVPLATVKPVTYKAADGTAIPAYLTLPPGSDGKGLPAIVMPHGGPAARDEWGFDWFAQFFANRGYAVLQPNYRGSTGYGDKWFADNGWKSWKTAITDVNDGGRWLVAAGVADPARLAIVGWSYGGYAALQANVLDPDLFKAAVAVAPVTDLQMFKDQAATFTNAKVVAAYVGNGPHIEEGSPARHAERFKAPVLIFHGDGDLNVDVAESRRMSTQLKKAGKPVELVIYKDLAHSLQDSDARADMLGKSDAFLRKALRM